jgi:hypothetical protein
MESVASVKQTTYGTVHYVFGTVRVRTIQMVRTGQMPASVGIATIGMQVLRSVP